MEPVLRFDRVSREFRHAGAEARVALRDVTAEVLPGQTVAVVGRSGSGKSTLIHLAAAIDRPTEGRVLMDGKDLSALSERERALLRREEIGLVFQFFHLLPHLTVAENVLLPRWIAGNGARRSSELARELLERVGLGDRGKDPVDRLSGGEMQRVAICRALIGGPRLILADEPTGSLDDENGRIVMDLLLELVREHRAALLLVTHSPELASGADAVWRLHSGELERS